MRGGVLLSVVLVAGCSAPWELEQPSRVRDPNGQCVVTGRERLDFGELQVGVRRSNRVTVANRAAFAVTLTASAGAPFSVTPTSFTLEPQGLQELVVDVVLDDRLQHEALLAVEDPGVLNGCRAVTTLAALGGGKLTFDASVDFGNADPGTVVERALRFTNTQRVAVSVRNVAVDPPFELLDTAVEVPANGTRALRLRVTTPALGEHRGTLRFDHPGGSAVVPLVLVSGSPVAGRPIATVSSTTVDFQRVGLFASGTSFAERRVFLGNDSTTDSVLQLVPPFVEVVPVTPTPASELRVEGLPSLGPLAAGVRVPVTFRFEPERFGARRWLVTLFTNDSQRPRLALDVSAQVESFAPCAVAVTPSLGNGLLLVGGRGVVTFTNLAAHECVVDDVRLDESSVDGFSLEGGEPGQLVLAGASSRDVVVRSESTGGVKRQGALRFHVAAVGEGVLRLPLAATVP